MCEILLRVIDKVNADPVRNARCTKRGDVIVVAEDGHVWGEKEKALPVYRIVRLPNVSSSEASTWLAEEPADAPLARRNLHRRLWRLDIDRLPAGLRVFLADDARLEPTAVLSERFAGMHGLMVRRPPLPNPDAIGENPRVI